MVPKICSIEDCEKPTHARGWCMMHYARWRANGDPEIVRPPGGVQPVVEIRLLSRSIRDIQSHCLRWTGARDSKGYGVISVNGALKKAHRASFEAWVGPIPEGLEIDHVLARGCIHRDCIEPSHLEAVTHAENLRRRDPSQFKRDPSQFKRYPTYTDCPDCGKAMLRKNIRRHLANFHATSTK